MGFLDNSGDIILDAVLTDTGRFRMAKGDGSFKIAKFALGDDEINYELYDKNHSSGSAYFDLDIMQTPVLEAFTNNTSFLHSKLVTYTRTDLLYLPVFKINEVFGGSARHSSLGTFLIAVDETSEKAPVDGGLYTADNGVMLGRFGDRGLEIIIDQGIDSTEESNSYEVPLDRTRTEFMYLIEIDSRYGEIIDGDGSEAKLAYIDDDKIATYIAEDSPLVSPITDRDRSGAPNAIAGSRGTRCRFRCRAADLRTSDFFFDQNGGTMDGTDIVAGAGTGGNVKFIDTTIRVTGVDTGYRLDIPVRFVKRKS